MRIGGVRIAGVGKRFWFIIGAVLLLFIGARVVAGGSEQVDPLVDPAFPQAQLKRDALQRPGWIGDFISAYGLQHPNQPSVFTANYAANVGLPMRFKVFIVPDTEAQESRPDLAFTKDGYSFKAASFIKPSQITSTEQLTEAADELMQKQPLLLGFRRGATPPAGQAYEVTALLYWRSDGLNPPDPNDPEQQGENAPAPTPVLLVESYQKLSASELRAPASQRVDLDLVYQEKDMELRVNSIEWSSGRELRACVTVRNTSGKNVDMWSGVSNMTADSGQGAVVGTPDENSALAEAGQLQAFQSLPGYITFAADVADPSQPLTLRMPALSSSNTGAAAGDEDNTLVIKVPSKDIKDVSDGNTKASSCAGGTGGADSSDDPLQDEPASSTPSSQAPAAKSGSGLLTTP